MKSKRLFLFTILILAFVVLGCCSDTDNGVADMEAQHKALILRIHQEVSAGNVGIFDEVLSPSYVRHCQAMPPGAQELHGTTEFKAFIADFLRAVPDCNDEVQFIIADSNMVAYVTTTTGTQTGPMGDLPASGKTFTLTNLVIHRFEDGKIAETWVSWDNVAMLTQLGHFPPAPSDGPEQADTGPRAMKCTRVYADESGETHFERQGLEFESVDFAPPAPPLFTTDLGPAEGCFLLKGPARWYGDWHPAPFRQLHFYLAGVLDVEASDGKTMRVGAGDIVLVEDTAGKGHRSRVVGPEDVVIAAVRLPAK